LYERRSEPVLEFDAFLRRMARHGGLSAALIAVSLGVGTLGYRVLGRLDWVDAFMNASMILTGMGPVNPMPTVAAKLFASLYALYSGIVFLVAVGLLGAPIIHRVLHRLHADG
jgi:hypothetical protein